MRRRVRPIRAIFLVQTSDPALGARAGQLLGKQLGQAAWSDAWEIAESDSPLLLGGRQKVVQYSDLMDPGRLPDLVRLGRGIEQRIAEDTASPDDLGPVRLHTGYLGGGKLVTASTEDDHKRIYVSDGVFAEVAWQLQGETWSRTDGCPPDWGAPHLSSWLDERWSAYLEALASH